MESDTSRSATSPLATFRLASVARCLSALDHVPTSSQPNAPLETRMFVAFSMTA